MSDASRLVQNILLFCRTLRKAGLPVGTGQVVDAMVAVVCAGIERRDDFYWALRSVLATDPSHFRVFDQAFHIYFRNPRLLERMISLLLPSIERDNEGGNTGQTARRLIEALAADTKESPDDESLEIEQTTSSSYREVLRQKDFEQMSLQEQLEARQILQQELLPMQQIKTRRFAPHSHGNRFDMRRSMRLMLRNNGQLIQLARMRRQERQPTLTLICDISGSMSHYSRILLQFAHTLCACHRTVSTFVFGTRLTNITHRLQDRDIDRALDQVSIDVKDWDGGTRIGDCLERFNVDWSRRVLAQDGVVILLSDGLERDSETDLEFQIKRLHRSCRHLIWMNPMLRYERFEPRANGIRKMLPHVDRFIPAHNIDSLLDLARLLGQPQAMQQAAGYRAVA
jgi:uncharacterized protein with von Willebrand factor type A (vWA) domain